MHKEFLIQSGRCSGKVPTTSWENREGFTGCSLPPHPTPYPSCSDVRCESTGQVGGRAARHSHLLSRFCLKSYQLTLREPPTRCEGCSVQVCSIQFWVVLEETLGRQCVLLTINDWDEWRVVTSEKPSRMEKKSSAAGLQLPKTAEMFFSPDL